jgi:hypothetical protein
MTIYLIGIYCGSDKPFIDNITLNIKNESYLDLTVDMPFKTISCMNQEYMFDNGTNEIALVDDCVASNLEKEHISLDNIYVKDDDTINIVTSAGTLALSDANC